MNILVLNVDLINLIIKLQSQNKLYEITRSSDINKIKYYNIIGRFKSLCKSLNNDVIGIRDCLGNIIEIFDSYPDIYDKHNTHITLYIGNNPYDEQKPHILRYINTYGIDVIFNQRHFQGIKFIMNNGKHHRMLKYLILNNMINVINKMLRSKSVKILIGHMHNYNRHTQRQIITAKHGYINTQSQSHNEYFREIKFDCKHNSKNHMLNSDLNYEGNVFVSNFWTFVQFIRTKVIDYKKVMNIINLNDTKMLENIYIFTNDCILYTIGVDLVDNIQFYIVKTDGQYASSLFHTIPLNNYKKELIVFFDTLLHKYKDKIRFVYTKIRIQKFCVYYKNNEDFNEYAIIKYFDYIFS